MAERGYQKMRYKGKLYQIGDWVCLKDGVAANNERKLVGKLLKILPMYGNSEYPEWPTVEVQWYYFGSELDLQSMGIKSGDMIYIGDNEVFLSDHTDIVFVESIINKCEVLSIQEYDQRQITDERTFYCRSKFLTLDNKLDPPFEEWATLCSCNKPMNPNLLTVGCDKWGKWFHPYCQGLDTEEAQKLEYFECTLWRDSN